MFKLINELLPSISQDQDSNINRDKEIFLLNQPDLLEKFSMDLLPVLIKVGLPTMYVVNEPYLASSPICIDSPPLAGG